ncbi:hypothetical protein M5D96_002009 [Drosophila gunungcola]|uniref:Crossover suppressor on 3 of Gowen n=1 Tax=Drosophila gunungcola TaxID=103775 RepID=A0A9P9YZ34_9MUSC|nr:hypothetical protein M5D96_002009 [Drosophila gunungcola]
MVGAKKRAGGQLAGSVQAKAPKKSTVDENQKSQIPIAKVAEAIKFKIPGNPSPHVKVAKIVAPNRHQRSEPPKNKTSNRASKPSPPSSEEKPKGNPGKTTPPVSVEKHKGKPEKTARPFSVEAPKKKMKKSAKSPEKLWKDIQNLAPGTGIILDSFMKEHNVSLTNLKKNDLVIAKNMRAHAMESLKKKSENINLKKMLGKAEQDLTYLKRELVEQQEKNAENINKYTKVHKEYICCEKNYENELKIIKACVEKQNADLKASQTRVAAQDSELKNLQRTNRELAAVVSKNQIELEHAQVANTEMVEYNNEVTKEFEGLKLKCEAMTEQIELCEATISQLATEINEKNVICVEFEERIRQLPIENNKVLSKLQNDLEISKISCLEHQRLTDQATKELERARNEINTFKTLLEERDRSIATLHDELKEMKAKLCEQVDINENYDQELFETKLKHSQELDKQASAHEIALSELKGLLDKGTLDFTQLKNNFKEVQKENLLKVSELQGKLNEMELQRTKHEEMIKSLSNELQMKTSSYEDELKEQHQQLTNQIEVMTSQFKVESIRNADEIQTLKAALVQNDLLLKAEQKNLQRLLADHDNLGILFAKLKDEKEKVTNELSAAKLKFTQELKSQEDNLKEKVSEMQMEINNKETEMFELERQKNSEMAVLQFKMNRINSVIDQPVHNVSTSLPSSKLQDSKTVQPKKAHRLLSFSKKLSAGQPRTTTVHSADEDGQPVLSYKQQKLSAVVKPQQEDLFDTLKESK